MCPMPPPSPCMPFPPHDPNGDKNRTMTAPSQITRRLTSLILLSGLILMMATFVRPAEAATFDPLQATEALMAQIDIYASETSDAYYEGRYWLKFWGFLYAAAVCFFLLLTLISSYIRDLATQLSDRLWLQVPFYILIYTPLAFLLYFPFLVYKDYTREHQYDLSNQTFFQWLNSHMLMEVINILAIALLLTLVYTAIQRARRVWWLWGGTIASLLLAFFMIVSPVLIEPMFNDFSPLEEGPLKQDLIVMAKAQGLDTDRILVYDGSRQSSRMSGHISGLFGTTRIALSDTILQNAHNREIRALIAHEIAHYTRHHLYLAFAGLAVMIFGGFFFLDWSLSWIITRYGALWRIDHIGDLAGLPLMILLISSYTLLITPLDAALNRYIEDEADLVGLEISQDPDAMASLYIKLAKYRKIRPNALEEFLFYREMPTEERILEAMRWKANHMENKED